MNITPEGIEVKVGQQWRDLDKRMKGRIRQVIQIDNGKASMRTPYSGRLIGAITRVAIRRMKKGSTGWELVK